MRRAFLAVLTLALLLLAMPVLAGSWNVGSIGPGSASTFTWTSVDTGDQPALDMRACRLGGLTVELPSGAPSVTFHLVPTATTPTAGADLAANATVTSRRPVEFDMGPYFLRPAAAVAADGGAATVRCTGFTQRSGDLHRVTFAENGSSQTMITQCLRNLSTGAATACSTTAAVLLVPNTPTVSRLICSSHVADSLFDGTDNFTVGITYTTYDGAGTPTSVDSAGLLSFDEAAGTADLGDNNVFVGAYTPTNTGAGHLGVKIISGAGIWTSYSVVCSVDYRS